MKKYLLFVLVILLFFTIDHPSVSIPRQKLLDQFITFVGESSKVKTEQSSELVLQQIFERLQLSQSAQAYLEKKLATDMSMKRFNKRYCENNELNVYFYGDDIRQICSLIAQAKK